MRLIEDGMPLAYKEFPHPEEAAKAAVSKDGTIKVQDHNPT
jgi:hypothetical protein